MTSTRKILMIPGPVECEKEVLDAMGAPPPSHTSPGFIASFGNCLGMMKEVWMCPAGQPFIVAGSGTLAMEMAAANLVEQGDTALVISTGYFGDRYADMLERFGAKVTVLKASVGEAISAEEVEKTLKGGQFKLMAFTHVDTSTAVSLDVQTLGALGKKYGVLSILDGVCSVAGEEIRQEEWNIDVVLTASQKALGVPPGLALLVASPKAMQTWRSRKTLPGSYYADWGNWLPIMEAYASGKAAYFGTPAVNLVMAMEASLKSILQEGMAQRFDRHQQLGKAFRNAMKALGLESVPKTEALAANTLSAPRLPEGVGLAAFMQAMANTEVVIAGGLLPEIKDRYFRVGHMGSVVYTDLITTTRAIARALNQCGHQVNEDDGVKMILDTFNLP